MASENWYDNHTKVAAFAQVLEDAGVLDPENAASYNSFIRAPFKFDEIYQAWEDMGFPTQGDDDWEEFTNVLVTEEEEQETEEEESE